MLHNWAGPKGNFRDTEVQEILITHRVSFPVAPL
jgi:hypothetical protein